MSESSVSDVTESMVDDASSAVDVSLSKDGSKVECESVGPTQEIAVDNIHPKTAAHVMEGSLVMESGPSRVIPRRAADR